MGVATGTKFEAEYKKYRGEYQTKLDKLNELYAEGCLPDTEFIDSFIPRVTNKFKQELFRLTDREQEVIDKLFEEN